MDGFNEFEEVIGQKDQDIANLQSGIYELEALQHEFYQKDIEMENLIARTAEVQGEKEQLQEDVRLYDQKLTKKSQYITELKEQTKLQTTHVEELTRQNEMNSKRLEMQIEHLRDQMKASVEHNQPIRLEELNEECDFDPNQSILSIKQSDTQGNGLEGVQDCNYVNPNAFAFNDLQRQVSGTSFV